MILQFQGKFPEIFKTLEKSDFTVKLEIGKENIGKSNEYYLATDIYRGFETQQNTISQETVCRPTEHTMEEVTEISTILSLTNSNRFLICIMLFNILQPSTSASYHLDNISQLKSVKQEGNSA